MTREEIEKQLNATRSMISELSAMTTHPEFVKLVQEIESAPSAEREETARKLATLDVLVDRGIPVPDQARISLRSFEDPSAATRREEPVATISPNKIFDAPGYNREPYRLFESFGFVDSASPWGTSFPTTATREPRRKRPEERTQGRPEPSSKRSTAQQQDQRVCRPQWRSAFLWQSWPISICLGLTAPEGSFWKNLIKPARGFILWSGLWHSWNVFLPNPPRVELTISARVWFKDDSFVLWHPPHLGRMSIFRAFLGMRGRKFRRNLCMARNRAYRGPFARQIAQQYRRQGRHPVRVDLLQNVRRVPPPETELAAQLAERYVIHVERL